MFLWNGKKENIYKIERAKLETLLFWVELVCRMEKNSKIFGFLFLQKFLVKNWRFCLFVHLFLLQVIVDEKKVGKPTIFCCLNLSVFDILFFLEKILTAALLNNFLNTLFFLLFLMLYSLQSSFWRTVLC
jgi:hypothetical protein